MPSPEQYREIAERYLAAGHLAVPDIPEAAGFASYHAFESIGAAWIRHLGHKVPVKHTAKINRFIALSLPGFRIAAARLATLTNGLREKMLYPSDDGFGGFITPQYFMSPANARDLVRRVNGFVQRVAKFL